MKVHGCWIVFVFQLFAFCPFPIRCHADQPNIVIFMVDDMGVMDTSVPFLTDPDGQPQRFPLNDFYHTPQMQRLAEQGIRFNQFQAMSVCSPTRISILTGQHSARHRTTNWINPFENNRQEFGPSDWNWNGLAKDTHTLPRLLHANGYRTIHIGKSHLGPLDSVGSDPTQVGFDINVAGSSIGHPGSYQGSRKFGAGSRHAVPHLDQYHNTDMFLTEALTIEAKRVVQECVRDQQPFFLHLSHYAVHSPFEADARFAARYAESGRSPQAQAFATLIEGIDKSLGDLLDHLEHLGVAENTLILFLGDNGTDAPLGHEHAIACAAPLRGKKGSHFEGGVRVPFIAAWAKPDSTNQYQQKVPILAGGIQTQLANVCDLMPTILEMIDVARPAHPIDGQSMTRMFAGSNDPTRTNEFLLHFPHDHRSRYFTSLRQENWKLIYHYFPGEQSHGHRRELFDLSVDPSESQNLIAQHPEIALQLQDRLESLLQDYNALPPQQADGSPLPLMQD